MSPSLLVYASLRLHNRPAAVLAAIGADYVRGLHRAALGAGLKLLGLEGIMRATHAGPRVRLFTLGDTHGNTYRSDGSTWILENPPA